MNPAQKQEKATILVVDDDVADRTLMSTVLKEEGYHVLEASSGESGLETFKKYSDLIDLIVTDMMMPGMNGVEFFRNVRKISSRPKVIFTSGYHLRHGGQPYENRTDTFIEKSVNAVHLVQKVHEVLDHNGLFVNVLNLVSTESQ